MSDKPEKSELIMAFVDNSNGVQVQSPVNFGLLAFAKLLQAAFDEL